MNDQSSPGYGQQKPVDTASEHNQMTFLVSQILGRISTIKPVLVKSVTNSGGVEAVGFVDVQPLVKQVDGVGNGVSHGIIHNIPYTRIQGGKNAIIMDPEEGDIGWAGFCDRDISAVKQNKAEALPGSYRKFDWADAIYIGGILNGIPEQYIRYNSDGIEIVDNNGNKVKMGSAGMVFTGPCTFENNVIFSQNLEIDGALTGVGGSGTLNLAIPLVSTKEITAKGIDLSIHHHTGVTTGGGNTGGPVG